jgi:transcriptional regulator with XRE-family HTH domain
MNTQLQTLQQDHQLNAKLKMENPTTEGEKLLLLVRRSGMQTKDAAEKLHLKPTSLSRIFKSERLTQKVKRMAATVFEVSEDFFRVGADEAILARIDRIQKAKDDLQIRLDAALAENRDLKAIIFDYNKKYGPL